MKRILISLMTIAVVGTVGFVGTKAYFTDTESSNNNTFSTGTIDIAVDDQNPWNRATPYQLTDMKPSQVDYANFVIHNVGTNPVNVLKKIDITNQDDGTVSEPECIEGNGVWTEDSCGEGYVPNSDIASAINYDLTVWVYDIDPSTTGAQPKWWQVIYTDGMGKKISTLNNQDTFLGMIPAGWYMKVEQSYHMVSETTNWAQGDNMTFDITLTGEQLKGTLVLENKDFANAENPTIVYDGTQATVTYGVKDSKFNYTINVSGMADGSYTLINYIDPWPGATSLALANVAVAGGIANVTGSIDLNQNLTNAKVWLVPGTYAPGSMTGALPWNPGQTLFETGLMDYYDSDL